MGLSVALSNALSGMNTTQSGLSVLSRNVSNAGTPGYHVQSLNVVDANGTFSTYAQVAGIDRAFAATLQRQYNDSVSNASYADVKQSFLERLQTYLGMPGEDGSLDTVYSDFENAMRDLATSPDSYTVRSQALSSAQNLAQTLNSLSGITQDLRQETEQQISEQVTSLNSYLTSLQKINGDLSNQGLDDVSRASLSDERDRLVANVAEIIDVQATYRSDGTVSLMTKSGLGLVDVTAATFEFQSGGNLGPNSLFNQDSSESGVGTLTLRGASGGTVDLVQQGLLNSGSLGALVELRDEILPQFQSQLDAIAAGLATSLNSVETGGTATSVGAADGFELDLGAIEAGNSFTLNYTESGQSKSVKVVRVDDTSKLPLDFTAEDGTRVVGLDFSGGIGAVATDLQALLGAGLTIDNPSGDVLRVVDDGAANTTDVGSLVASTTVTADQDAGTALNLFVDAGQNAFTGSLDGEPQQRGFASRISVSESLLSDNRLLVQYQSGGSLGDASRAEHLLSQLEDVQFSSEKQLLPESGDFAISGSVQDLIIQSLNFQGGQVERAQSTASTTQLSLDAVQQRMDSEYGVNVDEEMARLIDLQNAYAANARVVSIVNELLQTLMQI
ncbi:MAG: flagellar hook-associated protein FlgK [Hyphomicrobiaceae bacterium]|nr:flagellar hook-associated protein FlgK [Hyphomicrobiaceae bacterium]MCC0024779.1 flagellar hook-associated protein FlgK [Hyphomicrobiaceae bacterium]